MERLMYPIMSIPKHFQPWGFNAGIVKRPYGWLIADRIQHGSCWAIILRRFDSKFNEICWYRPNELIGFEDLRLMVDPKNENVVLGFGTAITYTEQLRYSKITMGMAEIHDMTDPMEVISDEFSTNFPCKKVDKNWMPFYSGDNLYLSYTIEPHLILKVNRTDFSCSKAFISSMSSYPWPYGELRGSVPPVKIGNQYLSMFHSKMLQPEINDIFPDKLHPLYGIKMFYPCGFYMFEDNPPFRITSVSRKMVNEMLPMTIDIDKEEYQIVFPMQLSLFENDYLYMTYGENDLRTNIVRLPLAEVLANMEPVETKSSPFGKLHV
jgi:hypothetical protein